MAAGKTTIGMLLAAELGVPFVDTDALVIARHGPIAEIFAHGGEPAFRALECEAVREALDGPRSVIALGGGAVMHEPTRALLAARALRVYLELPAEVLLGRLTRSRAVRPVVGRAPTLERVRELMAAREPLYRESELVVPGPRRSRAAYAREIARRVREHPDG
jgi:shikimate kinase